MVQNARVGFLGRVGQALTNPTTRETAQRQAVEADARTLALQDETELFNFLEQDGAARGGSRIIDGASGAFATTTLEDGTVVDSGLQELTKTREDGQLRFSKQTLAVANATRSIGTYKDENGNEVQGKVAGISTNDDGSYSLVMQRPDGKFAPKTWLSSTNPQDQVVKMSKEEFKDFMQLNLGVIQSRVKKNKGQAATALAEADRLGLFEEEGALVDEIDKDPNMSMEEKQEAILQIQQLISPKVDKTGTNTTPLDIDTPTTQATSTTPEPTNEDQIAPEGQRLPVYTVDTDSKPVQASENLLNNLSAETILSDGEIETLAGGLSKGFQQSFIKSYKFGQRLLDKNANDIATLEAKETRSSAEDRELQKLQTTRQKSLIPQQEKRLSRVRDNITTDRGSIEEARKASEAKLNAQITAKEKQIANPNLSEARKKELQAELTTLKKDSGVETVDITTDTNTYTVTDLPAANAAPEDFNNWYNTNKESLNQISKDGTIVNDVKKIITKFNVQSKEDVENIPFNTPAALDMSRFQFATILAGNGPLGTFKLI